MTDAPVDGYAERYAEWKRRITEELQTIERIILFGHSPEDKAEAIAQAEKDVSRCQALPRSDYASSGTYSNNELLANALKRLEEARAIETRG
jgi:ADP-heptose:LPS heptosyltransferase